MLDIASKASWCLVKLITVTANNGLDYWNKYKIRRLNKYILLSIRSFESIRPKK